MSRTTIAVLTAALAGAAVAAIWPGPAVHGEDKELDLEKILKVQPLMVKTAAEGHVNSEKLHKLVDELENTTADLKEAELRKQIYATLEKHIEIKRRVIDLSRDVLGIRKSPLSDQEVRDRLRTIELVGINWQKDSFKKCMRDISREINVPIRLQYFVVQRNTVEMKMRRASAESVLGSLCSGFDLRYVVHDGEIIIYKKITPTEGRFISYQERHPNVKLKYWKREKASGEYEIEEKK